MEFSAEYVRTEGETAKGCTNYALSGGSPERYGAVKSFASHYNDINNDINNDIISIGCGGYEPVLVNASYALDITPVSRDFLKRAGWPGTFVLGSCTDLPFPDNKFQCGLCVEVVEHLPTWHDVEKTFSEINRVCRHWLVTTPLQKGSVTDHKRALTRDQVEKFAKTYGAKFMRFSLWWFVWKGPHDPEFNHNLINSHPAPSVPRGAIHA